MFLIFPFGDIFTFAVVRLMIIFLILILSTGMFCASLLPLRILIEAHISVPHIRRLIGLRGVQNPTGAGGEGGAGTVLRHTDNRGIPDKKLGSAELSI